MLAALENLDAEEHINWGCEIIRENIKSTTHQIFVLVTCSRKMGVQ
jgi:hypothetical protein